MESSHGGRARGVRLQWQLWRSRRTDSGYILETACSFWHKSLVVGGGAITEMRDSDCSQLSVDSHSGVLGGSSTCPFVI